MFSSLLSDGTSFNMDLSRYMLICVDEMHIQCPEQIQQTYIYIEFRWIRPDIMFVTDYKVQQNFQYVIDLYQFRFGPWEAVADRRQGGHGGPECRPPL